MDRLERLEGAEGGAEEAIGSDAGGRVLTQLPEHSEHPEPTPQEDSGDGPGEVLAGEPAGGRRVSWWRVAAVAVIVALLAGAGGLLYAAQQLKDPAASGNHALTDTAATDQVIGDVSSALTRIFAYTPEDTQSTAQAARDVLAGPAASQYQKLFAQIRDQVATQQLTLTTRVVRAGVVTLTGHRARLLVFLDQTAQRAGAAATSAAAQLSVTAEYHGGHWRIIELKAR